MCGGYDLDADPEALIAAFRVDHPQLEGLSRGEHFPRMQGPILVTRSGPHGSERWLGNARWGLVPSWAEGLAVGDKLFNARAETLAQKPAFREAFRRRRCLVPVSAFYEWKRGPGGTQRYRFEPIQGPFLALAGLWEIWRSPDGERVGSYTVITVPPNAQVAPIHGRMPAVLPAQAQELWLTRDANLQALEAVLRPCNEAWLRAAAG